MPASEDLVEALIGRARKSAHAVSLAHDLFERRAEFQRALTLVREVGSEGDAEDRFRAAIDAAFENRSSLILNAEHRSDLLLSWVTLLVDVANFLERHGHGTEQSIGHRVAPFHETLDDEDLEIMEIDRREGPDLHAQGIIEAWQT